MNSRWRQSAAALGGSTPEMVGTAGEKSFVKLLHELREICLPSSHRWTQGAAWIVLIVSIVSICLSQRSPWIPHADRPKTTDRRGKMDVVSPLPHRKHTNAGYFTPHITVTMATVRSCGLDVVPKIS